MKHVVKFSGGGGSWAAAKRVSERHGTDDLTLLFTDTRMEDEDLYRFLAEAALNVGGELVQIADGRTPWEVFFDERMLGSSRMDPCSKILKRELSDRWLAENCDPADTVVYVGIDWTESHRYDREPGTRNEKDRGGLKQQMAARGWRFEAPLCEAPWMEKADVLNWMRAEGIEPPRLYELGFAHNNCGGFCVKAGQGHFANLLRTMPDRYRFHEEKEQEIRRFLARTDISILRDRSGGETRPLTLRELRERIETGSEIDMFDIGGCGCMVDEAAA